MSASRVALLVALLATSLTILGCGGSSDGGGSSLPSNDQQAESSSTSEAPDGAAQPAITHGLKVIVTTSLALTVEDISDAHSKVTDLARSAGGFVSSSNVSSGSEGRAVIELRIPASQLDGFLTDLKSLPKARLDSETVTSREVTAEYTDLQSRLRNLERTEAQYQQFLGEARTIDEVLNVSNRLHATRDEIEKTKGRINLYDSQIEFSTVKLTLAAALVQRASTQHAPDPLHALVDAWDASVTVFWVLASISAVLMIGLAWLVPLGVIAVLGIRLYRRVAPVVVRLLG